MSVGQCSALIFICPRKRLVIFATPKTLLRVSQGVATRKEFFNGGYTKNFPSACFVSPSLTRERVFYISLNWLTDFCNTAKAASAGGCFADASRTRLTAFIRGVVNVRKNISGGFSRSSNP